MKEKEQNYIDLIKPMVREDFLKGELQRTYFWKVGKNRNIYLYLHMKIKEINGQDVLFITSNLDSEEVRGQGKYLWSFLKKEMSNIANGSMDQFGKTIIMHQAAPNQYSKYLLEGDSDYIEKNGKFYAGYKPS